ncbi:SGNH/GDSL hydrolase family protein [Streptomyces turgidiscabies]|uniref:GDSL-like protein n=1 Tax=Streptomyces turgidiscabies (strain Car8) TaxID=698760 RepID=L7FHB6_STRT8|nr:MULTISPECIES: SGNH/GDSL hydrolase family protein [Streptomyces]ELP70075.1 GDSL-like protein [Streptomyces turgidiscabies Car8]MDX3494198.1 SGNH/GDSL hydrolase family protein [Streptomyces turgidiscabies]GAQ68427.1 GDSL-like Lipase/Acylhydrolase [Streptomyces turgidiscabies]
MRNRSRRSRAVVAVVTAALLGVAGCDAGGGASPAPDGARAKTKPSATPTPGWDSSPASMAAVGDSITRGFDACSVLSDCPEVSWATGTATDVNSLAVRLLGASGVAARSWNYAVSGSRMADLPAQMTKAAARRPALVTVMTGANDACRTSVSEMTSVAGFRTSFEQALRTLRKASPRSQVYVASVPDLKRLWSQGRGNELGKAVWKLGICPSMLADPDAVDAVATTRRDEVRERVEAYNSVLKSVCATDRLCRSDGGAVFDYDFGTRQLSPWDWFHPSRDGQARLAEMAYRGVTGKKAVT